MDRKFSTKTNLIQNLKRNRSSAHGKAEFERETHIRSRDSAIAESRKYDQNIAVGRSGVIDDVEEKSNPRVEVPPEADEVGLEISDQYKPNRGRIPRAGQEGVKSGLSQAFGVARSFANVGAAFNRHTVGSGSSKIRTFADDQRQSQIDSDKTSSVIGAIGSVASLGASLL